MKSVIVSVKSKEKENHDAIKNLVDKLKPALIASKQISQLLKS